MSGSARIRLVVSAAAAVATVLVAHAPPTSAAARPEPRGTPPDGPNVVVVMTDDQTVEEMQALPRVRALIGREGTTFTENLVSYPLCCPSRATYLTGQYAHNHGVRSNQPPYGGYYALDSSNTLPVWLSRRGYATAHTGKYLNHYGNVDPRAAPPGWQHWWGTVDPSTYHYRNFCVNHDGQLLAFGPSRLVRRTCPGARRRAVRYQTDLVTHQATEYLRSRAHRRRPFFLSVAYLAPHFGRSSSPVPQRCTGTARPARRDIGRFESKRLPRPPSFDEADVSDKPADVRALPRLSSTEVGAIARDYRCRRESLLAVDDGVEAIVSALRRTGKLADTLVIFTSDNGYLLGEHRIPRGKIRVYEESVRVPVLMRGPGVPRGRRVSSLTANVDLAPTILGATGTSPGRVLDGVSLVRVARRPQAYANRAVVLESGPDDGPGNPQYSALRSSRWAYVEYVTGERELYDLRADPYELSNRAADPRYESVRLWLAGALRERAQCVGEGCRRPLRRPAWVVDPSGAGPRATWSDVALPLSPWP